MVYGERSIVSQLNLTTEQQSQLKALREEHRQAMQDQRGRGSRDEMNYLS
ncbi:Spy/CpxP family protein refolding chaperone [Vibrio metschnikovii]